MSKKGVETSKGKRKGRRDDNGFGEWGGYMPAKIQKLQEQFEQSKPSELEKTTQKSDIFDGIAIFVNGYTNPTSDVLKKLMKLHGGVFHHYYSRDRVTHIIATNLPNSKVDKLTDQKIVHPDWITTSVKANKLLPYQKFMLYKGRTKLQPAVSFGKSSATSVDERSTPSRLQSEHSGTVRLSSRQNESAANCDHQSKDDTCLNDNISNRSRIETQSSTSSTNPPSKIPSGDSDCVTGSDVPNLRSRDKQSMTQIELSNQSSASSSSLRHDQMSTSSSRLSTVNKANTSPAKAGDANFVSEFYSHSRLHHLSTWGAEFRAYVNQLQSRGDSSFPGREKLRLIANERDRNGDRSDADTVYSYGQMSHSNRGKNHKVIMHVDMDSFFVSVGLRDRPNLVGKPVAVTHSKGKGVSRDRPGTDLAYEQNFWKNKHKTKKSGQSTTETNMEEELNELSKEDESVSENEEEISDGAKHCLPSAQQVFHSMAEVASCSYEARKAGVKNGMLMGKAKELCPDIVTIPYDFDQYREVSQQLYDIVASYTHDIEAVSCDEMLVDCSDLLAATDVTPLEFASALRREIKEATRCNASAGLGPNILVARLATRKAKPDGQLYVESHRVTDFIKDTPVSTLPGVGWALTQKLRVLNVESCSNLQQLPLQTLQKEFGPKTGQSLFGFCRGQDDRSIRVERERKSVSAEINYGIRFTQDHEVEKFLGELGEEVHSRLQKINRKGKTITLKMMVRCKTAPKQTAKFMGHGACDNMAKSATIPLATDDAKILAKEAVNLFRKLHLVASDIRGIGIQISRLVAPVGTTSRRGLQSMLDFTTKLSKSPPEGEQVDQSSDKNQKPPDQNVVNTPISNDQMREAEPSRLPPLPTLPDFSSPEPSQSSQVDSRSESPALSSSLMEDLCLPSPSQVDPAVLHELPPNMRRQIERALLTKGASIRQEEEFQTDSKIQSTKTPVNDDAQPGCSHWAADPSAHTAKQEQIAGNDTIRDREPQQCKTVEQSEVAHSTRNDDNTRDGHKASPVVALPSYSQLDPSCLDALPPDLRDELETAYAQQRQETAATGPQLHPLFKQGKVKSPHKSPKKGWSPAKPTRGHSPFKAPSGRGRKKRMSPKKLDFKKQRKIDKIPESTAKNPVQAVENTEVREKVEVKDTEESKEPSLCHVVSLQGVKDLLQGWICSCDYPEESDTERVMRYLMQLVQNQNMERVELLLKYIYRRMKKKNSIPWRTGFDSILEQVQATIQSLYGGVLKWQPA